jgi:hypothetical protein
MALRHCPNLAAVPQYLSERVRRRIPGPRRRPDLSASRDGLSRDRRVGAAQHFEQCHSVLAEIRARGAMLASTTWERDIRI